MTSSPPARSYNWNDLGVRALSAVVLIPLALFAVVHGGWLFLLLVSVGAALLGLEWGMISAPQAPTRVGAAVLLAVVSAVFAGYLGDFSAAFVLLVFGAAAAALYARFLKRSSIDAAYGVLYVGWPCVVLVWLRGQPDGMEWTVLLFAVAWASDICAYLIGSLFKGPKLWPRFSPNKTWSGFVGGLIAGAVATVIVARFLDVGLSMRIALLVGVIASLATMAGDLWESALKRRFGVKDAGQLIPGHGGLMDRVDGMMFAVVALAASRLVVQAWGIS
jgi:phosphatidate cytidylyltransferase